MCQSALSSFLWLNCNILLFGHAGFYVPTHHWMGISCFPCLAIINTATITFVHTCLCWPKFVSLGNWPGSRIARSWSNSLLIGTLLSNIAPVLFFFFQRPHSWRKLTLFLGSCQSPTAPRLRVGLCAHLPSPCWTCAGLSCSDLPSQLLTSFVPFLIGSFLWHEFFADAVCKSQMRCMFFNFFFSFHILFLHLVIYLFVCVCLRSGGDCMCTCVQSLRAQTDTTAPSAGRGIRAYSLSALPFPPPESPSRSTYCDALEQKWEQIASYAFYLFIFVLEKCVHAKWFLYSKLYSHPFYHTYYFEHDLTKWCRLALNSFCNPG